MNVFDRKYCIVDGSGNFYTVNENDELVAVKDESKAEWFDILEANKRINSSGMAKSLRTITAKKSMMKKKQEIKETDDDNPYGFCMEDIDFGRLVKELRLSRKEKIEELNKVRVIAEAFDCKAMAEAYRNCENVLNPHAENHEIDIEQNAEPMQLYVPEKTQSINEDIEEAV